MKTGKKHPLCFVKYDAGEGVRPGKEDEYGEGDCTVRAITTALNLRYDGAWSLLHDIQVETMSTSFSLHKWLKHFPERFGVIRYLPLPAIKGRARMNGVTFCAAYPQGRFVLRMAGHVVAVVDGKLFDLYDSTQSCVYCAWEVSEYADLPKLENPEMKNTTPENRPLVASVDVPIEVIHSKTPPKIEHLNVTVNASPKFMRHNLALQKSVTANGSEKFFRHKIALPKVGDSIRCRFNGGRWDRCEIKKIKGDEVVLVNRTPSSMFIDLAVRKLKELPKFTSRLSQCKECSCWYAYSGGTIRHGCYNCMRAFKCERQKALRLEKRKLNSNHHCFHCRKKITSNRTTKKFCSTKCRVAMHRKKQ